MDIPGISITPQGLAFFDLSGERGTANGLALPWEDWKAVVKKVGTKRKLTKKFLEGRVREGSTIGVSYGPNLGGYVHGWLHVLDLGEGYEYTYDLDTETIPKLARAGGRPISLGEVNKRVSDGIRHLMETPPEDTE